MKKLVLIISLSVIASTILFVVMFLSIPRNLNNTLRFNDAAMVAVSISTTQNIGGRLVGDSERFLLERDSTEFAALNYLLDKFSYNRTFERNTGVIAIDENWNPSDGVWVTIVVMCGDGMRLAVTNHSGRIIIGHRTQKMPQNDLLGLIDGIAEIIGFGR